MVINWVKKQNIFYLLISIGLLTVLWSSPFLRYPYDMFHHLIIMDDFYIKLTHSSIQNFIGIGINDLYIMIPNGMTEQAIDLGRPRYLWHYIWAYLFYLFGIDSTQMFLRAKIIHVIQTYISLFSIYYFSKVVIRNTLKKIDVIMIQWLSLWSVVIWITIFATFSGAYHQVWMMWYSINYQITLPLFWYMLGLTLVLVLEETSWRTKLFFVMQIVLLSRFMLQVHSMEFLYYLMHLSVLTLVYIDKIYLLVKKYFYIVVPVIFGMMYMAKQYQPEKSQILNYLSLEKFPQLYDKIMQEGLYLINGYNRAYASINELMYLIGFLGGLFLIYQLYLKYYKKTETYLNTRILIFITITSLFVLIPLYQFSGGLFSLITYTMVVNRLYYSTSLFVLLPIIVYTLFNRYNFKLLFINIVIALLLILVGIFSKYSHILNHNYYKNLHSIQNSFHEKKVGFNLSQKQIEIIGVMIDTYEKQNKTNSQIRYYARADIAFVLKYMYKKNVDWEGRFGGMNYKKNYKLNKNNPSFRHILFDIPKDFPPFIPYK